MSLAFVLVAGAVAPTARAGASIIVVDMRWSGRLPYQKSGRGVLVCRLFGVVILQKKKGTGLQKGRQRY
jgi:hypothetical protein